MVSKGTDISQIFKRLVSMGFKCVSFDHADGSSLLTEVKDKEGKIQRVRYIEVGHELHDVIRYK